jgi:UV DNA damage repair endonuclease
MEDRKELIEKLRVTANRIERNRLDYRYACDRIILDKLYEELTQTFNDYLKIKDENENKVKSIKFMNYGKGC